MPRRLAQQRMTLNDLDCLKSTPFGSRAISAVAELLVNPWLYAKYFLKVMTNYFNVLFHM